MQHTDLLQLLKKRASVRSFKSDPVPRETLDRILQAGQTAPSGSNRRPWLFAVVEDPDAKAEIRRHAEADEARWKEEAPEWIKEAFPPEKSDADKSFLTDAPCLICVFGIQGNPYWRESAWVAIGYTLLQATAENLGSFIYIPGRTSRLSEILKIADPYRPLAVLPLGHPAETPASSTPDQETLAKEVVWNGEWCRIESSPDPRPEDLPEEIAALAEKVQEVAHPELIDSRVAYATMAELAGILQNGSSAAAILPALSRTLTKLVPSKNVEIVLRGSALRLEFTADGKPDTTRVKAEPGKLVLPLTIGSELFGTIEVDREEPYTQAEIEVLNNAGRVLSLGLWSRFIQVPKR